MKTPVSETDDYLIEEGEAEPGRLPIKTAAWSNLPDKRTLSSDIIQVYQYPFHVKSACVYVTVCLISMNHYLSEIA